MCKCLSNINNDEDVSKIKSDVFFTIVFTQSAAAIVIHRRDSSNGPITYDRLFQGIFYVQSNSGRQVYDLQDTYMIYLELLQITNQNTRQKWSYWRTIYDPLFWCLRRCSQFYLIFRVYSCVFVFVQFYDILNNSISLIVYLNSN